MNNISSLLSAEVLKAIEQGLGINFPKPYRNYLVNINGESPEKNIFNFNNSSDGSVISTIFGIVPDTRKNILYIYNIIYKKRIPSNTFPIADDVFGNQILLSIKGPDYGKVYFWDHEREADIENGEKPSYDNLTLIADSFDDFMNNLHSEADDN